MKSLRHPPLGGYPFCQAPLDERRVHLAFDEGGVVEDFAVQGDGGLDALDHELGQGPPHAGQGLGPGRLMDQQLGHQRIVVRRHPVAGHHVRVEPHARARPAPASA